MLVAGFGTTAVAPETEEGWSQHTAGVIHWQCGMPAIGLLLRAPHPPSGPARAEPVAERKPSSKVSTTAQLCTRGEACALITGILTEPPTSWQ